MNIITKEAIQSFYQWPAHVVGAIMILTLLIMLICCTVNEKLEDKLALPSVIVGLIGIIIFLVVYGLCSFFYRYDTGRYRYTATIDEHYTVEELYDNYTNIHYNDETKIYTFEDKE